VQLAQLQELVAQRVDSSAVLCTCEGVLWRVDAAQHVFNTTQNWGHNQLLCVQQQAARA
jgi:hypothetical protein